MLSEQAKTEIDHWVAKYPSDQKQSAVMSALMIAQEENGGWLTQDLIHSVAEYLEIPAIRAMEVATFYSMYELKPVGRHVINLCTNVSCLLCGSDGVVDYLKEKLGIGFGETTEDGRFTLKEVECLAYCDGAPVMLLNKTYYTNLTPELIDSVLDELE